MTDISTQERTALIESRIDKERAAAISISGAAGGLSIGDLAQVFEFAKAMSTAGPMIPVFLRNNPGACLGICLQAIEWRMSPFSVANKAYAVEQKGEVRVAYESQLIHAIIEARAPIKGRLNVRYEGEGDDRVCIVSCTLKGEDTPREHRSPPLGKRKPGLNSQGQRRGSPLWDTKPDVQSFYDTSRDLARILFPDIIMGIYSDDELGEVGFEPVKPALIAAPDMPSVGGGLHERLSASALAKAGFDPKRVHDELDQKNSSPPSEAETGSVLPLAEPEAGKPTPAPEASPVSPSKAGDAEGGRRTVDLDIPRTAEERESKRKK